MRIDGVPAKLVSAAIGFALAYFIVAHKLRTGKAA